MREVKFRGRCVLTGEWLHGGLIQLENVTRICWVDERNIFSSASIDKKTLAQYTGLKDKNGREIYEGDIVKYGDCSGGGGFDYYETVNVGAVEYDNETISYFFTNRDTVEMHEIDFDEVEVIGNIYENPELLEAKL